MKNIYNLEGTLYILSDEPIKNGDYGFSLRLHAEGFKPYQVVFKMDEEQREAMEWFGGQKKAECKKVIFTTDPDLIKAGVQLVPIEFTEWWYDNGNCDYVEVISMQNIINKPVGDEKYIFATTYRMILSKEKQQNIISDWLEKHGELKITEQVEVEASEMLTEQVLADLRNKMGPIANLLAMLQEDDEEHKDYVQERIKELIPKCEQAIEYLRGFDLNAFKNR